MSDTSKVEWEPSASELYLRAKTEAIAVGDDYLGTQHLLLAAIACGPLEDMKAFAIDQVRAAVIATKKPQPESNFTLTPWCHTPRFKLAIQCAMQRAWGESRSVTCLDVWYGLLADGDSESSPVLCYLGVDLESLRNRHFNLSWQSKKCQPCPVVSWLPPTE